MKLKLCLKEYKMAKWKFVFNPVSIDQEKELIDKSNIQMSLSLRSIVEFHIYVYIFLYANLL